jgi:hypothetical protein
MPGTAWGEILKMWNTFAVDSAKPTQAPQAKKNQKKRMPRSAYADGS